MQLKVVQPFAYLNMVFQIGDIIPDSLFDQFKNDPDIFGRKVVQVALPSVGS